MIQSIKIELHKSSKMKTQKEISTSIKISHFSFFFPLITLKCKLTPYQRKSFELLHDQGGKVECWPNLAATFRLLERKGVPLKFTPMPSTTAIDDKILVEIIYPA